MADLTMDKLVALCKNRGLIFAGKIGRAHV